MTVEPIKYRKWNSLFFVYLLQKKTLSKKEPCYLRSAAAAGSVAFPPAGVPPCGRFPLRAFPPAGVGVVRIRSFFATRHDQCKNVSRCSAVSSLSVFGPHFSMSVTSRMVSRLMGLRQCSSSRLRQRPDLPHCTDILPPPSGFEVGLGDIFAASSAIQPRSRQRYYH